MGKYNFDQYIERRGTDSSKWDGFESRFLGYNASGALPMWVADMDFTAPDEVIEVLKKKAAFGIYGYPASKGKSFDDAFINWMKKRHDLDVTAESLVITQGVVPAITYAVQAFTNEGDGVLIQPPVYYPFKDRCITYNKRKAVESPLIEKDGSYTIDFEDFERKAKNENTKLFILCSPHNPVGRVWTEVELRRIVEICQKHHVLIFSDEIHSDLIMEGFKHTPTLKIAGTKNIITAYAASKTFNLAGLRTSIVVIPDESIRQKYMAQIRADEAAGLNLFGLPATEAAYTYGEDYLQELLAYIGANIQYAAEYIKENIPNVAVSRTEGTYFLWIDFRKTGLTSDEINRKLLEQAKVAGDLGGWFGKEGEGFIRLNLACPRSIVEEALKRIESVFGN